LQPNQAHAEVGKDTSPLGISACRHWHYTKGETEGATVAFVASTQQRLLCVQQGVHRRRQEVCTTNCRASCARRLRHMFTAREEAGYASPWRRTLQPWWCPRTGWTSPPSRTLLWRTPRENPHHHQSSAVSGHDSCKPTRSTFQTLQTATRNALESMSACCSARAKRETSTAGEP